MVSFLQSFKTFLTSLVNDQKQQVYRAARKKELFKGNYQRIFDWTIVQASLNLNQYIIDNHIKAEIELDLQNLV